MACSLEFDAYEGHALDLGTYTFGAAVPGSSVILRIGRRGVSAVEIESAVDTDDELTWTGTNLSALLLPATVDELENGKNVFEYTVVTALGVNLAGPRGIIRKKSSLSDI